MRHEPCIHFFTLLLTLKCLKKCRRCTLICRIFILCSERFESRTKEEKPASFRPQATTNRKTEAFFGRGCSTKLFNRCQQHGCHHYHVIAIFRRFKWHQSAGFTRFPSATNQCFTHSHQSGWCNNDNNVIPLSSADVTSRCTDGHLRYWHGAYQHCDGF